MLKVARRNGFSDRNGIKKLNTEIQVKDFDERTRINLAGFEAEEHDNWLRIQNTLKNWIEAVKNWNRVRRFLFLWKN